jgi:pimeloyl-ACP methyl ester carboxylesterase
MPPEEDVGLYYEFDGQGPPLIFVHGSWGDANNWALVVPELSKSFRVVTYDRRGHSRSSGTGTREDDVDDLAALIEHLDMAPAIVAGNSFGAIVTLQLATKRPELFRALIAHEPPLFDLLEADPQTKPLFSSVTERIDGVADVLRAGDAERGAKLFMETIAFGPGAWDVLPEPVRETFVRNASTWLDEMSDPGWASIDLDALGKFSALTLLSEGNQSTPEFPPVVARLLAAMPAAEHRILEGAGHVPQSTHPDLYIETLKAFLAGV